MSEPTEAARLLLRRHDGQVEEFALEKDEVNIGRRLHHEIVLADRNIAPRHAVIRRSSVGYVIEDQQTINGTFVNGERIKHPVVLGNGDIIRIGECKLIFFNGQQDFGTYS
jgi:pSer/pThr/pTyr-binding forkhead associated (FHA) protein